MSWNVVENEDDTFTLLNGSQTLICRNRQVSDSVIIELMSKMEEVGFSIEYTTGLKEIYFTRLLNGLEGDYDGEGNVRIACNKEYLPRLHEILIHEIGHHIDAQESISFSHSLVKEWIEKSGSFNYPDIKKEHEEYFALGFEIYHLGGPDMSKNHPILWKHIDLVHKKKITR